MSDFRKVVEGVCTRTGMYIQDANYQAVAAFLLGYDTASEGGVLLGFREWLIPRVGGRNNLVWPVLVLYLAFPNAEDPRVEVVSSAATEKHAIDVLFRLVMEFDDLRRKPNGLRKVYLDYERWLRTQDWYDPDWPDWLDAQ